MLEYKKEFFTQTPLWGDFISALDYKFNNPHKDYVHDINDGGFVFREGLCTDIFVYNRLDPQFWNVASSLHNKTLFKQIDEIKNLLSDKLSDEWYAKALINFVGKEAAYSAHKDPQDVISWQCIGNVEYRIYEDVECEFGQPIDFRKLKYDSYILSPGDVIYLPKGTIHQAVVFEPRATIIFDVPVK